MRTIRRITKAAVKATACVSLILALCETTDGTINLSWNLGWLAVTAISAKILDKMGAFKEEESK